MVRLQYISEAVSNFKSVFFFVSVVVMLIRSQILYASPHDVQKQKGKTQN
jgi:hypothetical protein